VETPEDALSGASDIIAEMVSDTASYLKKIREFTLREGVVTVKGTKEEASVYQMYYDFSENASKIAGHRVLAVNRGEKEGFLSVSVEADEEKNPAVSERRRTRP
jgi:uncharacterized protein